MGGNSWQAPYDTGWINRSDWTSVHMGSSTTKDADSDVAHNLNAPLSKLLVKVLVSTDGTDNNSYEVHQTAQDWAGAAARQAMVMVFQVDANNIRIQTGVDGFPFGTDAGATGFLTTENYYYKIKVYLLG